MAECAKTLFCSPTQFSPDFFSHPKQKRVSQSFIIHISSNLSSDLKKWGGIFFVFLTQDAHNHHLGWVFGPEYPLDVLYWYLCNSHSSLVHNKYLKILYCKKIILLKDLVFQAIINSTASTFLHAHCPIQSNLKCKKNYWINWIDYQNFLTSIQYSKFSIEKIFFSTLCITK